MNIISTIEVTEKEIALCKKIVNAIYEFEFDAGNFVEAIADAKEDYYYEGYTFKIVEEKESFKKVPKKTNVHIGFRFSVDNYEPCEKTFDTFDECVNYIKKEYPAHVQRAKISLVNDEEDSFVTTLWEANIDTYYDV